MDRTQRSTIAGTTVDSLLTLINNEMVYVAANGPKYSYSFPWTGESLAWPEWLIRMQGMVKDALANEQAVGAAWAIRSRGRT